jgi:branched-chain amino acid transport system permease protein
MDGLVAYGVVGLSVAAIYAIVGSGLVLTYATTGVFNFGHGATGMLAAFSYWQLTAGWGWPVAVALGVVLLVLAPAYGLLVERVIIRPVQHLGDAERLVMTVALLSGSIAFAQWVWDPNVPRPLEVFLADQEPFRLGSATITRHQALTMVLAVVVAVALWALLNRTRLGVQLRATVDDRSLVELTGADPDRAHQVAWIVSTQLAALGGILVAPLVRMDAADLSLLIVSAYSAAVFGRLRSLPLTFAGALVVGCLESYLTGYLPANQYLPGLRLAAPALLLFVALLLFPHRRLRHRADRPIPVPLPSIRGTAGFAALTVFAALVMVAVLGESNLITYGVVFSLGLVALSFVPLTGYAGQIALCQLSMAGIGAITWAHLGSEGQLWALLPAMLVPALVGALVALPALRLSGIYLALATAAFAVVLDRWIFGLPSFEVLGVRVALFEQGSVIAAPPAVLGVVLDSPAELTVLAAVCLALASLGVAALRRGRLGRRLIALRDSEPAYATSGGSLVAGRVLVFALAAGIAGFGGAVYGMQLQTVTADRFTFVGGLPLFLVAVIGGLGSVGNGLFTGAALVGPLGLLSSIGPRAQQLAALLPALAGLGLGRSPQGVVPMLRAEWGLRLARLRDLARRSGRPAADVPLEWWGLRRDWRPDDREELSRGLARG